MRDKKVHSNVLAVHELVHSISDLLGQPLAIQVQVILHTCVCVWGGVVFYSKTTYFCNLSA